MSQGESLNVWFVRDDQSGRYGPIDLETLRAWVRDGRIGPANEVSRNGTDWFPAARQHGLEMDWVAEVDAGRFYGPIHREAMRGLIEDGSVTRHAPLFRRFVGDAGAMAFPQPEDDGRARKECERLERELEQALAKANEAGKGQGGQARGADLQRLRQTLEAQAREVETRLNGEAAELGEALRLAKERAEEMEARLHQGEREWASAVQRFEGHAARLQTQIGTLQADALALEQERQRLAGEAERASSEASERMQRIAQMEAAAEASRQEAARLCDALEAKANDLQAKLSAAQMALEEQRRLTEKERSRCAELQKSEETARREGDESRTRLDRTVRELEDSRREGDAARVRQEQVARELEEARQEVERLRRAAPPPREVLEVEVLPPERPATASRMAPLPPSMTPPAAKSARGGEGGKAASSLADLERLARLELERLGAQGSAFFAKKK